MPTRINTIYDKINQVPSLLHLMQKYVACLAIDYDILIMGIPGESDVGDGVAVSVDGSGTMSVAVGVGTGVTVDVALGAMVAIGSSATVGVAVGEVVNKVTGDMITCKGHQKIVTADNKTQHTCMLSL